MKKIKFMLMSLVVVAAVGGTLAFKAKLNFKFCTTIAREVEGVFTCVDESFNALPCPNLTSQVTTANGNSPTIYCTTEDVFGVCPTQACDLPTKRTIISD